MRKQRYWTRSKGFGVSRDSSHLSRLSPASTRLPRSSTTLRRSRASRRFSSTAPTGTRSYGSEKSPGIKLFAVSGHVERPGIYEAPMGTTMRELLEWAGGVRSGHSLEVLGARRVERSAADRGPPRCSLYVRGHRGCRFHARHRNTDGVRRDHQRHSCRDPLAGVLQARVVRQVHPLP